MLGTLCKSFFGNHLYDHVVNEQFVSVESVKKCEGIRVPESSNLEEHNLKNYQKKATP